MPMFIIQTVLLVAIAYLLGCIIGSILRSMFGVKDEAVANEPPARVAAVEEAKPAPAPAPEPGPPVKAEPAKPSPAKPAPAARPKTAEPAKTVAGAKDDLKRIRGIGPQNEARLNNIGVTTFAQVAAWSAKEQREIGERLSFPGRIEREEWVSQAKVLAKGGETGFSKRVDSGEVESSTGKVDTSEIGIKPPVLETAPAGGGDALSVIGGVGNALEKKLNAIGIYTYEQISKWTAEHQVWVGNELGFRGRPERENWVSEAAKLAAGEKPAEPKKPARGAITAKRK